MSYRIVGPPCSSPGCKRPVWDHEHQMCAPCWYLATAFGLVSEDGEPVVQDSGSAGFDAELRAWIDGEAA